MLIGGGAAAASDVAGALLSGEVVKYLTFTGAVDGGCRRSGMCGSGTAMALR